MELRRLLSARILFFLAFPTLFLLSSCAHPSPADLSRSVSSFSAHRSILALKSDPLKARLDQILKQANDHKNLLLAYASYARKLKLENSKHLRVLSDLARSFSDLISRPSSSSVSAAGRSHPSEVLAIDEPALRRFEKDVKERIKLTRQVVADAKGSFDNQLRIQKLKDSIFALNELLTKAKKQGAFSNLIAAKSIPKSIHVGINGAAERRFLYVRQDFNPNPTEQGEEMGDAVEVMAAAMNWFAGLELGVGSEWVDAAVVYGRDGFVHGMLGEILAAALILMRYAATS